MSGRDLTSFRDLSAPLRSEATDFTPESESRAEKARYIPDATDLIYHALRAEQIINVRLPAIFAESVAIDNARFAGQGASFAVYSRHVAPQQRKLDVQIDSGDGWSSSISDTRRLPKVIAYKVPRIEFDDKGRPSNTTKHAMFATVMELYLTSHRALLQHKNIVDFLGLAWSTSPFDSSHKVPALVVEFSELGSLAQVQQQQYVPLNVRRRLCLHICDGLQALHACNVLHGDLKAENVLIFLDEQGCFVAKLSDFGYSHVLEQDQPDFAIGGTRPWQAPETNARVIRGNVKATDVYSLSLLVWCTLAHGVNIFKVIAPRTEAGGDYHASAESLKSSGTVNNRLALSCWYMDVLRILANRREARPLAQTLRDLNELKAQMQDTSKTTDVWAGMELIEKFATLALSTMPTSGPAIAQMLESARPLHLSMEALSNGLSLDPTQRDLSAIVRSLGGSLQDVTSDHEIKEAPLRHVFQWADWPKLQPWLQSYLSMLIERRREVELQQNLINPPEALLLAALYTNGYGLECDTFKAIGWMRRAMQAGLQTASAYSYRHLSGLGYRIDEPRAAIPVLEGMALRGSRTALEDTRQIWPEKFRDTRQLLRDNFAGVGADFFCQTEMLGRNNLPTWQLTLKDIDKTLPLLRRFSTLADHRVNKRGDRVLHLAASCGQTEAIRVMLESFSGCLHLNQLNDQGETMLLSACRAGQLNTAMWLLEQGADARLVALNGESPLHWMISFDEEEVIELAPRLFKGGAEVKARTELTISYHPNFKSGFVLDRLAPGHPIGWATTCNRSDIVKLLLDHTRDPTICAQSWPCVNSALEIAAAHHRVECLRLMLNAIEMFNAERGHDPWASFTVLGLLHQAVFNSDFFNLTLFHGPEWKTNLHATLGLLVPMCNRCFNHGFDDGMGATLLYWAVSLARDETVDYLLDKAWEDMRAGPSFDEQKILSSDVGAFRKSDINKACGIDRRTPLLEAVRWNRMSLVRKLIDHGASTCACATNPFSGEASTWTAVHVLAQAAHDKSELPSLLRDAGVAIDGPETTRQTTESPLLLAIQNNCFNLAKDFISLGADVNIITLSCALQTLSHPSTILGHLIASNARNSVTRIRFLLTNEPFASTTSHIVEPKRQWTALHRAAAGHLDVHSRDTDLIRGSPLQWSDIDWDTNAEIMGELLFRFPQHVNAMEKGAGDTALHLAVRAGNAGSVRLLLVHDVQTDLCNSEGEDAQMLALRLWAEMLSTSESEGRLEGEAAARKECAEMLSPDGL